MSDGLYYRCRLNIYRCLCVLLCLPHSLFAQAQTDSDQELKAAEQFLATNPDSSLILYRNIFRQAEENHQQSIATKAMGGIGNAYLRKGDFTQSKLHMDKSIAMARLYKDTLQWANMENNRSLLYQQNGLYTESIQGYYQAIDLLRSCSRKEKTKLPHYYNNLGGLWLLLKEYGQAADILLQAKAIIDTSRSNDDKIKAYIYTNLGLALAGTDPHKAWQYLTEAAGMAMRIQDKYLLVKQYVNLAAISLEQAQYDSSLHYVQQALAISRELNSPVAKALASYQAGHHYLQWAGKQSFAKTASLERAMAYLQEALSHSFSSGLKDVLPDIYNDLSRCYAAQNNHQEAYRYARLFNSSRDSLLGNEKNKTVSLLMKYTNISKDKELTERKMALLQNEYALKQKDRWILLFSVLTAGLIIVGLTGFQLLKSRAKLKSIQLQKAKEIELLKASIEGAAQERDRLASALHDGVLIHFSLLKRDLAALAGDISSSGANARFRKMIDQFDHTMNTLRHSAHNLMPDIVMQQGFIQAIANLCASIESHSDLRIDVIHIGERPELHKDFSMIIYNMIQELLHNILKHAHAQQVLLQTTYLDQYLDIVIEDDGVGYQQGQELKGAGLVSIMEKIKAFKGSLEIKNNEPAGTSIYLSVQTQPYLIKTKALCP